MLTFRLPGTIDLTPSWPTTSAEGLSTLKYSAGYRYGAVCLFPSENDTYNILSDAL
eukprot:EC719194.1.p3 GENE.EC719194.1~~EC719194.1.p3  ORF type:complete len:56 (-),score=1.44 EC719194.1:152-319(-)